MRIVSFDVFDTVLLRKCGRPENIYYILAKRLFPSRTDLQDDFYRWRLTAEATAERKYNRHVCIEEIYSCLDYDNYPLMKGKDLIKVELDVERENLIINPSLANVICQERKQDTRILFISDMYLHSSFLVQILKYLDCFKEGDELYVSCDEGARKSDGSLFDKIYRKYNTKEWIHYGDNIKSDFQIPKKKGITPHLVKTDYSPSEKAFLNYYRYDSNSVELSILAGLQRSARLSLVNNDFANISADYVASSYIPYAIWTIKEAQKKGFDTLYFISRDSYLIYKIAQQFICKTEQMSLRYLFVSRKSLLLPSLYEGTVGEILESYGVDNFIRKDSRQIARTLGLKLDSGKLIRTAKENSDFSSFLKSKQDEIKTNANAERKLLLKYFAQEGLLSLNKSALVDVGWYGTTRLLINRIIKNEYGNPLYTFYWMCFDKSIPFKYGEYFCYYQRLLGNMVGLSEMYYSASPYKSVLGYKLIDDIAVPVFNDKTKRSYDDVLINNLKASLMIATWLKQVKIDISECSLRKWSSYYIYDMLENISQYPYKVFEFVKEYTDSESREMCLIKRYSKWEIVKYIMGYPISFFEEKSAFHTFGKKWMYFKKFHDYSISIKRKIRMLIFS